MPAKLEEIEGRFVKEHFRRDAWMIGTVQRAGDGDDALTIKGECEADELAPKTDYRFYGRFSEYKGERQFSFQTFVPIVAHDRDGVIEYLARAGAGLGMGKGTARKCWETFGPDAVREIRKAPRLLRDINPRISDDQCDQIGGILVSQKATEDATIELTNLLAGRGLPKVTARKAIKKWGNKAARIIRRDPYALMSFRGCGFRLCDALYIELGHSPTRLKRQALCAWHAIARNTDGHTWHPVETVAHAVAESIGGTDANPKRAIQLALRLAKRSPNHYGALAAIRAEGHSGPIVESGGSVWIAEGRRAEAERDLAEMIARAVSERGNLLWPDVESIKGIDEHQRQRVADALTKQIAILGGSPGTGKTYTTAMLIKAILASGLVGVQDIAIAAPTGKAAVRITEAMQAAGVPLQAKTWHSLLGVGEADAESGDWSFQHGRHNPWPFRVIIGDEMSMCDTALMRSIMAARPRGCHFLLVGDVHQLPPVGNGAPLRDMIASGVIGYGELTEIKRNSGGIVEACAAIRDGLPWSEGDNLKITGASGAENQIRDLLSEITECRKRKLDPVWDCQVQVIVNEKSPLSRKAINTLLQSELNSNEPIKGTPFRIGDKVVCKANGNYTLIHEDAVGDVETRIANGELGRIVEVEDKSFIVSLNAPDRTIRVPRGRSDDGGTGCNWDLGYALTAHKCQGSEFPYNIVLLDEYPGARRLYCREMLYTEISRARQHCTLVGKKSTADAMCRRVAIGKRRTFLRQRIQLENARRTLELI